MQPAYGEPMQGPWPAKYLARALLDAVTTHFAWLETEYGFTRTEARTGTLAGPSLPIEQDPLQLVDSGWTVFRWTSATVVFSFTLAPSRHEVDLSFHLVSDDPRWTLEMHDLLGYLDPALAETYDATYYVHDYETWPEIVPRIAAGVRAHAGPWLRGDPQAYAHVRELRGAYQALYTARNEDHITREQYSAMRRALDQRRFAELLGMIAAIPPRGLFRRPSKWLADVERYLRSRPTDA